MLTRGAYSQYVSTATWRERRWRLFSTFPFLFPTDIFISYVFRRSKFGRRSYMHKTLCSRVSICPYVVKLTKPRDRLLAEVGFVVWLSLPAAPFLDTPAKFIGAECPIVSTARPHLPALTCSFHGSTKTNSRLR